MTDREPPRTLRQRLIAIREAERRAAQQPTVASETLPLSSTSQGLPREPLTVEELIAPPLLSADLFTHRSIASPTITMGVQLGTVASSTHQQNVEIPVRSQKPDTRSGSRVGSSRDSDRQRKLPNFGPLMSVESPIIATDVFPSGEQAMHVHASVIEKVVVSPEGGVVTFGDHKSIKTLNQARTLSLQGIFRALSPNSITVLPDGAIAASYFPNRRVMDDSGILIWDG